MTFLYHSILEDISRLSFQKDRNVFLFKKIQSTIVQIQLDFSNQLTVVTNTKIERNLKYVVTLPGKSTVTALTAVFSDKSIEEYPLIQTKKVFMYNSYGLFVL